MLYLFQPQPHAMRETGPASPIPTLFTETFFYVREGKGSFLIENQIFPIEKDDLIIVNPHLSHTEISNGISPLSYFTVGVDGISFSFNDHRDFPDFLTAEKNRRIFFFIFNAIFQELDKKAEGYESICMHLLEILTLQLKRLTDSAFEVISSQHPSRACAAVKRYLDSSYSESITLDDLAVFSHLNKYYLSHEFTKYYGISPISYLNRKRIEVCKELLENSDYGISDIAHQAGFSSQSYLSQSFRKYCGMSAGTYRKLIKQNKKQITSDSGAQYTEKGSRNLSMNRSVTYHITEADASMQILDFLRSKGFSRHILSSMKAEKKRHFSQWRKKQEGRTLLKKS